MMSISLLGKALTARTLTASALAASILSAFLISPQALAYPSQVIIVRHGEKVTDQDTNLSARGKLRAQGLVSFVSSTPMLKQFGPPVAVFAARPKADHSTRAVETAQPLADALGQPVHTEFGKSDEEGVVNFIMRNPQFNGKTVFLSWVHDDIPELAHAFGLRKVPKWDGKVFDRAWVIRFSQSNGAITSAVEINQDLLPGDSPSGSAVPIGRQD